MSKVDTMGEASALAATDDLILIGSQAYPAGALFGRYEAHELGQFHAGQPLRYSQKYAYDRAAMLADLGNDVHPVKHGQHTEENIVRPLLRGQLVGAAPDFSIGDIGVVRVAALTHDFGECQHPSLGVTIGDIDYQSKTAEHELAEVPVRTQVMHTVYPDLPDGFLEQVEDVVANKSGTPLRELFNTAEHIGYFMTMAGAGRLALRLIARQEHGLRTTQLARMAVDGARLWHDDLLGQADRYPYVAHLTTGSRGLVDQIDSRLTAYLDRA